MHLEVGEDRAKRVSPPDLGTEFYNVDGSQSPQFWDREVTCCKIVFYEDWPGGMHSMGRL